MDSTELNVALQLEAATLGSVKVRQLNQLVFEDIDVQGSRALNQSRIKNIIHRFEHEGCRRFDPLTWIPCEISKSALELLLQANFQSLSLGSPIDLELQEGSEILCLQGQHRITAALEWLAPNDRWWHLIIYDSDQLNAGCRKRLREAENGSQIFSDGEIFQNIRHYQLRGEEKPAQEWLAKWSPSKCRDFNRIYSPKTSQDQRKILANKLDTLLAFPALWVHWLMGTHLTSLNCPEELSAYLHKIHSAWIALTCGSTQALDPGTVELLQGRYPRLSLNDRRHIHQIFADNLAFPRVTDPASRSQLLQASLNYTEMIPSLHLFLENTKYLKAMVDVLKKALPPKCKGTIRQVMRRSFIPPLTGRIQVSENDFEEDRPKGEDDHFWSAYRQCFLFAMRHFYGLTDLHPRGHSHSTKPHQKLERSDLWKRFEFLLHHLGFAINGPQDVRAPMKTEYVAVQALLSRLRPPDLFEYDHSVLNECSNYVANILTQIKPRSISAPRPFQSTDSTQKWALTHRCGMTDWETFFSDRRYLFLQNIYALDDESREDVTSFAVKRDIFKSFFPSDGFIVIAETFSNAVHRGETTNIHPNAASADSSHQRDVPMSNTTDMYIEENDPSDSQAIHIPENRDIEIPDEHSENTIRLLTNDNVNISSSQMIMQSHSGATASLGKANSEDKFALSITSQSSAACKCRTDMTADLFWASYKHTLSSLSSVIFFGLSNREVLFFRLSNAQPVLNIAPEVGSGWCAKAEDLPGQHSPTLRTLARAEIQSQAMRGGMFFYGDIQDLSFRSTLKPCTPMAAIVLPFFDTGDETWKLEQSRNAGTVIQAFSQTRSMSPID